MIIKSHTKKITDLDCFYDELRKEVAQKKIEQQRDKIKKMEIANEAIKIIADNAQFGLDKYELEDEDEFIRHWRRQVGEYNASVNMIKIEQLRLRELLDITDARTEIKPIEVFRRYIGGCEIYITTQMTYFKRHNLGWWTILLKPDGSDIVAIPPQYTILVDKSLYHIPASISFQLAEKTTQYLCGKIQEITYRGIFYALVNGLEREPPKETHATK